MSQIRIFALPLALALGLASVAGQSPDMAIRPRHWTEIQGRSIYGIFLSASDSHVSIRKEDGMVMAIERKRLSPGDRAYLDLAIKADLAAESQPNAGKTTAFPGAQATPQPAFTTPEGGIPTGASAFATNQPMLAGYGSIPPNFARPWPTSSGVSTEPVIQTIEESEKERRYIYESPHFRFESNVLLRPILLAKVAMMFEACYQTHYEVPLNNRRTRSPKAAKLKAKLFETKADYFAAGGPRGSDGVYKPAQDVFLVPLEVLGVKKMASGYAYDYSGSSHVLFHEITHQLWADLGDCAGMWMVEGFAEFMASAPYNNGRFTFLTQPRAAMEYATGHGMSNHGGRALGDRITMPHLSTFMTMTQVQFMQDANANYGFGMLLTHYFLLLDGRGDGERFKKCIQVLQEGKNAEEARQALLNGRSYEELEKDFATAMRAKGVKVEFQ